MKKKDIIKKLNKYIVSFDYLDKIFIALPASFGTLSIASHATVVGKPLGRASSSLSLIFTISIGVNINPRIVKNKHNRSMIQSNCVICNSKKSRFIKEHQGSGLLSNLGIKTPLNKVALINILF